MKYVNTNVRCSAATNGKKATFVRIRITRKTLADAATGQRIRSNIWRADTSVLLTTQSRFNCRTRRWLGKQTNRTHPDEEQKLTRIGSKPALTAHLCD